MKSFWSAVQIAVLFTLVTLIVLAGTLMLFGRVAGHGLLSEMSMLRCHEGVRIAEKIEALLETHSLDDPEVTQLIKGRSRPWRSTMELTPRGPDSLNSHGHPGHRHGSATFEDFDIGKRQCRVIGPPVFESQVPVFKDGALVATLILRGSIHPPQESHREFLIGVLEIGTLALIGVIALSVYLTRPIRRMSRSMDRIADGDLDHRVNVRGRNEVAAMGRSFNAMADRIGAMIMGEKELLAGVSHELRSPLARMKVALELLRESGAPDEKVNEVEEEVDAIDAMVEELLTASRLDLGSVKLTLQDCAIEELAERAWRRVEAGAEKAGMRLEIALGNDARMVEADEALMVRVLGNLFENAVRYADTGTVRLTSQRRASQVEIAVTDEGPGVPTEVMDQLFEPFFRADPSRSRKTGATGLGLMIVRRAVEAHGGTVTARSGAAGGLVVTLTLPRAQLG